MVERGELMVGFPASEKCHFLKIFLWKRQGSLGGFLEGEEPGWFKHKIQGSFATLRMTTVGPYHYDERAFSG